MSSGMQHFKEPATPTFVPETQLSQSPNPINPKRSDKELTAAMGGKSQRWTKTEDEHLARLFVTISDDPINGNNQTFDTFWVRINDYYNSNCAPEMRHRNVGPMKSHWYNTIQTKVNHFNAIYNSVESAYRSGHSDEDLLRMAYAKYLEENNHVAFNYEHVWRIVKDRPLFRPQYDDGYGSSKKSRTSESDTSNSTSTRARCLDFDLNINETRPIGQKAAKRKGKGKAKDKNPVLDLCLEKFSEYAANREKEAETKKKELELEERKLQIKEYEFVYQDTSKMSDEQRANHKHLCAKIVAKWNS